MPCYSRKNATFNVHLNYITNVSEVIALSVSKICYTITHQMVPHLRYKLSIFNFC